MIFVVIPVFNRIESTLRCIRSILRQDIADISIIVVDDGSSDGTEERLHQTYPQVTILRGTGSLFWTGAIHYAMKFILSRAQIEDSVILVNNDVILEPNAIAELLKESKRIGAPALLSSISIDSEDGETIIGSGTRIKSWLWNRTEHVCQGTKYHDVPKDKPIPIDLATARCLFHPIEIVWTIGNYNAARFPHYGGDCEFSARARKHGYKSFIVPSSRVTVDVIRRKKVVTISTVVPYIMHSLLGIRSSINIRDKFFFALLVVPWYAKVSYFVVGVAKSIGLTIRSIRFR